MTDTDAEIRERIQLFSLLRAAQRALSRCLHPAALDPVREHGRQLLIQLQALADPGADDAERHAEALAGIDRLLAHQMGQTLEIVANLEFAQLRVSVVASDGEAESAAAESRTLEIANRPPVIVSTPEGLDASSRFFYRVEVVDGDGDRNLRYELLKGPRGMEMDAVFGELTWTPEPDQTGTHRVKVAVDDRHGGRATQAFDIPIAVMELMPKSPPASIR